MDAHRAGQFDRAAQLYSSVLKADSRNVDAAHLLGVLHLQQGRAEKAVELIDNAARQRPGAPDILANLAIALTQCRRLDEALSVYDRLSTMLPGQPMPLQGRAIVLSQLGRTDDALRAFDSALKLSPNDARLLFERGNTLAAAGRMQEAVAAYDRAYALAPRQLEILLNRGNALSHMGEYERGLADYDRVLAVDPSAVLALSNRGNALKALGRTDEALAAYERALALKPDHADTLNNVGALLFARDRAGDALRYFEKAIAAQPGDVTLVNHRGVALMHLDRNDDAMANAEQSLRIDPDNFDAHFYFLRSGRFAEGWRLYERRWASGKGGKPRAYPQLLWDGQPTEGPLLVWAEQGLGDQILFCSTIADLQKRAKRVTLEVEPRLVGLFRRSFEGIDVTPSATEMYSGPAVAQICLTSLGQFFRPDWSAFPHRPEGYLIADPARAASLRNRIAGDGRPVIGLSWSSPKAQFAKSKSAGLIDFAGLIGGFDAHWVDLQYGDTAAERDGFAQQTGRSISNLDDLDNTNDIDGLAALITACDLVVTVSNTTAHLAGALGRPTWVLVPFGHSRMWYWHSGKDDNPWYPNARVRSQRIGQPWRDLVGSVAGEISAFASTIKARTS